MIFRGCRQACCAARLIRSPTRKPTSSPTLCTVWEKWILLRLGRATLNGIRRTITFKDLNRIDGKPTEFEWKTFPGITTLGLFEKFSIYWKIQSVNLSTLRTGSHSCQCTMTLHEEQKEVQTYVNTIHRLLRIMLADFLAVTGLSWSLEQKRNGTEVILADQSDLGTKLLNKWRWISQNPVIRYFVLPAHLREDKYKAKSMATSLFTSTIMKETWSYRTLISENLFSVYGAKADLCNELSEDFAAPDHLETMEILAHPSPKETPTKALQRGNLVQEYERKFGQLSEDQKFSKPCSSVGLKLVEKKNNISILLIHTKDNRCNIYAENTRCLDMEKWLEKEDSFSRIRESVQSST